MSQQCPTCCCQCYACHREFTVASQVKRMPRHVRWNALCSRLYIQSDNVNETSSKRNTNDKYSNCRMQMKGKSRHQTSRCHIWYGPRLQYGMEVVPSKGSYCYMAVAAQLNSEDKAQSVIRVVPWRGIRVLQGYIPCHTQLHATHSAQAVNTWVRAACHVAQ